MGWNYQVIKRYSPYTGEYHYSVHEIFKLEDGEELITEDAISLTGDSVEELIETLQLILKDINSQGIRDYEEFYEDV